VLDFLAGNPDPQVRQDALSTLALIGATGAIQVLRQSNGNSSTSRGMHRLSGDFDDLLQDDDQSAVSKQRRPPFLFTLGCKF
jgi:hypothetical protein